MRRRRFAAAAVLSACVSAVFPSAERHLAGSERPAGVIYLWSASMPLSRTGIPEIRRAAQQLGLPLIITDAETVYDGAGRGGSSSDAQPDPSNLARALVASGATVHFPSVVVHRRGAIVGGAIVGFKTEAAYRTLLHERLAGAHGPSRGGRDSPRPSPDGRVDSPIDIGGTIKELRVPGRPGAYFRYAEALDLVSLESGRALLMHLGTGQLAEAPGLLDFIPSPDSRIFVTPKGAREGLLFFDGAEVARRAAQGSALGVQSLLLDGLMHDQYPSIGVIAEPANPTTFGSAALWLNPLIARDAATYRVLTSWSDSAIFRDYLVSVRRLGGQRTVIPLNRPTPACSNVHLSLPILAPNGREIAGRDEDTGTTKLFRLGTDGSCTELVDLGVATGKIAWSGDARRVAFAVPRGLNGPGAALKEGVYVFSRNTGTLARIRGSEQVRRLTFPEFAGPVRVLYLMTGENAEQSRFVLAAAPQVNHQGAVWPQ